MNDAHEDNTSLEINAINRDTAEGRVALENTVTDAVASATQVAGEEEKDERKEETALVETIKKDEVEAPAAPSEPESQLATNPIPTQPNFDEIVDNKEDYITSEPVLAPEPAPPIQPQVDNSIDETMQKEEHSTESNETGENDLTTGRKEEAVDVIVTETHGNDEVIKLEGNTESTEVIGNEKSQPPNNSTAPKKKRVRRVGKTPTRKIAKLNEGSTPMNFGTHVPVEGTTVADANGNSVATAAAVEGLKSAENDMTIAVTMDTLESDIPNQTQRVLSKHDEKWNAMFVKLLEFKEKNKNTLVPQCYTDDQRLGRWVHYQRVEYWIFQQTETAKITEERIGRLDAIDFEWDPQKAQWDKMFEKLKEYKKENNHCRVPKGYEKDWELANWVRNQRLEQANLSKLGKKSRMTPERFKLLDDLGFKWSIATPARANRNSEKKKDKIEEQKKASKIKLEEVSVDKSESMMAVEGQVPTAASNGTFADTLPAVANEPVATETIAQSTIPENPEEKVCIDVSAEHVEV